MFLAPEGDHYRVRLTHTLDVSHIARTVARALRLNEDLTEAIALGHDLGHTPFGHLGEQALTPFLGRPFRHSEQSLRVVDYLEDDGHGPEPDVGGARRHREPPVVDAAARHARGADRAVRRPHRLHQPRPRRRRPCRRAGRASCRPTRSTSSGHTHGDRINTLVIDLIDQSADRRRSRLSPAVFSALDALRDFLFEQVYLRESARERPREGRRLIRDLFSYFLEHPDEMPREYHQAPGDLPTRVADFIAGMTDRYALRTYERLFLPQGWL